MQRMTAYRLQAWGRPAEFTEVDVPHPGPGEVLLKMAAVGLCGSDIHMFHAPAGALPFDPPFTLGHENAGVVVGCGTGVSGLKEGMAVLASSVNSCGYCEMCLQGRDEYCSRSVSMSTRGIGIDGGLADYLVVPQHSLITLQKLPPAAAAPLADAGGTSYHAVSFAREVLVPGSTALVIGAGGLGSFAIQYLRLLCAARIIAVDKNSTRLAYSQRMGSHDTLEAGADNVEEIKALTDGRGVDAVLDFVGTDASMLLAAAVARPLGRIVICGMSAGTLAVAWGRLAPGCQVMLSIGFSLKELREVVALAEQKRLIVDTEEFPFSRTPEAYGRLERGELQGRAVVTLG
jgi:alcohol dehydrogenase, propanol-preferring